MNNGESNIAEQITKVVSYVKDGLLAIYCCNNQEKASEGCRQDGTVIHHTGSIPDGIRKEYYGNGTPRKYVPFKDGLEHGLCCEYYPGGEIFEENHYRRGVLHGPSKTYRRDGPLWMEANYKNGKLHGPYATYGKHGIVIEEGKFVRGKSKAHTGYSMRPGILCGSKITNRASLFRVKNLTRTGRP